MKQPDVYFFDMDHTLIAADCDVTWKYFAVKHKLAPESAIAEADRFYDDYVAGKLDVQEFYRFQFREFTGNSESEMALLAERHFQEYIRDNIYPDAVELVCSLLARDLPVAILTSTNSVLARPVAEFLGIREVLGTTLELKNGRFTGNITGVYGAREGKVTIASEWAKSHGFRLDRFAYYGDSINDANILEAVGFPHAVNPSDELRRLAEKAHWPILCWKRS